MRNIKEDIEGDESKLSDEKYDYNLGRDAYTFLLFLKDSNFYSSFYKTHIGEITR